MEPHFGGLRADRSQRVEADISTAVLKSVKIFFRESIWVRSDGRRAVSWIPTWMETLRIGGSGSACGGMSVGRGAWLRGTVCGCGEETEIPDDGIPVSPCGGGGGGSPHWDCHPHHTHKGHARKHTPLPSAWVMFVSALTRLSSSSLVFLWGHVQYSVRCLAPRQFWIDSSFFQLASSGSSAGKKPAAGLKNK